MFPDGIDRPIEVLLVEDNPADALLVKEALGASAIPNTLYHVEDGVEAMAFLRREAGYEGRPRPDLILLDINMPRMDGHEALAQIKADDALRHIPVIMLSTSNDGSDILASYRNYASSYISKPGNFMKLVDLLADMGHYWKDVAVLPEASNGAA